MMDLSVILVEYKDTEIIMPAVSSLNKWCNDLLTEILIISNSCYSAEEQIDIALRFFGIKIIFNKHNNGFGKACNQGMVNSTGKYVLLLNPDCRLVDSSIKSAVDFMEENPHIGIIGPMITDETGEVQDSCRYFMTPLRLLNRSMKRIINPNVSSVCEYTHPQMAHAVNWVSGACMLVRRSVINSVGMFDNRYFMYVEDMDWCRTFWNHDWEVWYQPAWKVEHNAMRASTEGFSITNRLVWFHITSLMKYYVKWFGK